jgi:hypothetical protein
LIAVIAVPVAWTSLDDYIHPPAEKPLARVSDSSPATSTAPAEVMADATQPEPGNADAPAPELPQSAARPVSSPGAAAETVLPPPPPAPRIEGLVSTRAPAEQRNASRPADTTAPTSETVVAGARAARPKAAPSARTAAERQGYADAAVSADEAAITVTGARRRSAGRGDWNACTVDDPARDLGACRRSVERSAYGAAEHVSLGLAEAWDGDLQSSIAAFDRAVAAAPRSAFTYLNRGLAHRRGGDLDRALADLDKAVRYAPRDARAYYNRSVVLRARGETRRARADEIRAIELDARYADILE